jgi:hypothetical protein
MIEIMLEDGSLHEFHTKKQAERYLRGLKQEECLYGIVSPKIKHIIEITYPITITTITKTNV